MLFRYKNTKIEVCIANELCGLLPTKWPSYFTEDL